MSPKKKKGVSLTVGDALDAWVGLRELDDLELEARARFKIARLRLELKGSIDAYEAARIELCERHAEKDDDGNPKMKEVPGRPMTQYDIPRDALEEVNNQLEELRKETVTVTHRLTVEDFRVGRGDERADVTIPGGVLELLGATLDLEES